MHQPCPTCAGFGHVCPDDDPNGHIHDHEPPLPPCENCGGRGLVPIPAEPEPTRRRRTEE